MDLDLFPSSSDLSSFTRESADVNCRRLESWPRPGILKHDITEDAEVIEALLIEFLLTESLEGLFLASGLSPRLEVP